MSPYKFIVTMKRNIRTTVELDYRYIADIIEQEIKDRFGDNYKISVTKEQPKRYRQKLPKVNIG